MGKYRDVMNLIHVVVVLAGAAISERSPGWNRNTQSRRQIRSRSHRLFIGNDSESAGIGKRSEEVMGVERRCATSKTESRRETARAAVRKSVDRGFEPRPPHT